MWNWSLCSSDTEPEERVFNVLLGAFLNDVVLKNITFSTGVLTVEQCKAAGFIIREHGYPNGTKGFSIQVPFDDDVVLKRVCGVCGRSSWTRYLCPGLIDCLFKNCRIRSLGTLSTLSQWSSASTFCLRRLHSATRWRWKLHWEMLVRWFNSGFSCSESP